MDSKHVNRSQRQAPLSVQAPAERATIFGLRYIEEEAAEIHDVVGCLSSLRIVGTCTSCDDID